MQIQLAEQHGSGSPQHSHLIGVLRGHDAHERKRAAGRWHVRSIEVVFEQDRDAVQRPARTTFAPLAIQLTGVGGGAGVDGDHRVQPRSGLVVGLYARDVRDTSCSEVTCPEAIAACNCVMLFSATSNDSPDCAHAPRPLVPTAARAAAEICRNDRRFMSSGIGTQKGPVRGPALFVPEAYLLDPTDYSPQIISVFIMHTRLSCRSSRTCSSCRCGS